MYYSHLKLAATAWVLLSPLAESISVPSKGKEAKYLTRREDAKDYDIDDDNSARDQNLTLALDSLNVNTSANYPFRTVNAWVALGDSFAAGPGAGESFDGDWDHECMRGTMAYPNQMQNDDIMKGPNGRGDPKPEFDFVACTGAQTYDLLDMEKEDNQLKKIDADQTTFATLSITGNDVRFSEILKACVFGLAGKCDKKLKQAEDIMFNSTLWTQYNKVLNETLLNRFKIPKDDPHTLVYQQGYIQFFNDTTDQCDNAKFRRGGPKLTKELRKTMNTLTHKLNYVVQYWMDLRNVEWTSENGPFWSTYVDWVDVDWKYNNHRFCRQGVDEPDQENEDTWFFHLPWPISFDDDDDPKIVDSLSNFTWTPGVPSEDDVTVSALPYWLMKAFHPKEAGFAQSSNLHLFKLYYQEALAELPKKKFIIMCVGDYLSLGRNANPGNTDRLGYLPHLHRLLDDARIFNYGQTGGPSVTHVFSGTRGGDYQGDLTHEIYPNDDSIKVIANAIAKSWVNFVPVGKVIPVMIGHAELLQGREPKDIIESVRYLLFILFRWDTDAIVLLSQVPMYGLPHDGKDFYPMQKRFIEYNALLAGLVTEYSEAGRKIVKVHTSTTTKEHLTNDRQFPSRTGNERIARDFLEGMVLAQRRKFFEGAKWDNEGFEALEAPPDLPAPADGKQECLQPIPDNGPKWDEIKQSLFRYAPYKTEDDENKWIENVACDDDTVCAFSWDNGTTCVYSGGSEDGERSTHHQLIIQKDGNIDKGDCKASIRKIFDDCINGDERSYGGIVKTDKGYYSITSVAEKGMNPLSFTIDWSWMTYEFDDEKADDLLTNIPKPRDPYDTDEKLEFDHLTPEENPLRKPFTVTEKIPDEIPDP
ncbi:hypothetical protein CC78DRAFT_567765 [Lojkania enalia]|uniref:SGNH hydrolase-type esterase domain-containing protein n=1 Tax=Lojkania enalia TaxID=147567 RepID=A0A9P4KBK2_9PLEO|nr:hypothetical protein CC78DRAFT_567765 [Didymosphaeria enalia]